MRGAPAISPTSIAAATHLWLTDEAVSNLSGKWRLDEAPAVQKA